jgi:hypothetical protein
MCYRQNLANHKTGRDGGGLGRITREEVLKSALYVKFGLICPCICTILVYRDVA